MTGNIASDVTNFEFKLDCWKAPVQTASIPNDLIIDPEGFFDTKFSLPVLTAFEHSTSVTRYESGDSRSLADCNALSRRILDDRRRHPKHSVEETLRSIFSESPTDDRTYFNFLDNIADHRGVSSFLGNLKEAIKDRCVELKIDDLDALLDTWKTTLIDALYSQALDADNSSPSDLLNKSDQAEIVFIYGTPSLNFEDNAIQSHKRWSSPDSLVVDENLLRGIGPLGYDLKDFRTLSSNVYPTDSGLTHSCRSQIPRKAPNKIISPEDLASLIDNASTTFFVVCAYAIVPLLDLAALDLTKPIKFKQAAIASYNPLSGTFFDSTRVADLVVKPSQGAFYDVTGWYSPNSICGLNLSYYRSSLANVSGHAANPMPIGATAGGAAATHA